MLYCAGRKTQEPRTGDHGEDMKRLRLYALHLTFLISGIAILLCAAELLLRYSIVRKAPPNSTHTIEAEYLPAVTRPNWHGTVWGVPVTTNRYGFRDEPDFSETPLPGEVRILALGDSIGFGVGIPASSHYTKVAEGMLKKKADGQNYRIINAGGQGYSPSCYHVYLKHQGLRLNPVLIVTEVELCNDITDEALLYWDTESTTGSLNAVRGGRYIMGWDGNMLATCARGPYFFERTYVYTDLLRRSLDLRYKLHPTEPFHSQPEKGTSYYSLGFDRYLLDEQRIESGWTKAFGALEQTSELLKLRNTRFLLMILPSRYMFNDSAPEWQSFASNLVRRACDMADKKRIPYVNMTEAVRQGGGARLFMDFAHLNEEGNRVVGRALSGLIQQALSGKGASRKIP
jgi:hypothetical protein